jgi:hypothetical protein
MRQITTLTGWWAVALFLLALPGARAATVAADKTTGQITVETARYQARFDGGMLVYLHNKLAKRTLIDVAAHPQLPVLQRTALYVADAPKTEPYWIYPATEGAQRAAVAVKERGKDGVAVTFTGLITQRGKEVVTFPEAELTVTVAVDEQRGDLLVSAAGRSPKTLVVGSAVAYSGLTAKSFNYTTAMSGLTTDVDLLSKAGRRTSVLEWSNSNMGKRLGLKGGLWPAAVTVQAAAEDPKASFAVWAEDDVPRSKYLIEAGKGNAYVTYEVPPYDQNHQAVSVVWHVNAFDGGWTAAAAPFADSLKRRGMVDGRAPWRQEISLVIFANGISSTWVKAMEAAFPPEVRPRILIWLPQAWRTLTNTKDAKTTDAYYWDNNFSAQTAADIKAATAAGFRVSGYTNPHYQWGSWQQVIDPQVQEVVKGFSALPIICPVAQEKIGNTGHTLAYTPYREHMLRTYTQIFDTLDMSVYMDTTHQMVYDGRGTAVDGMTSYEGALKFYRGARALKRDQFIGSEFLNELAVMGSCADYGLFYDLVWSQGWEQYKASHTHPILSYLYRDTSIQISQRVNPWSYGGPRYYHLAEEISERIGTIATTEWPFQNTSPADKLDTPERQHWFAKLQLFTRRSLRPHFPEKWDDGVMSYLKAKDGAIFKYLETDFGSKLVEFPTQGVPVLQSARAWKTPIVKAGTGYLHDWIGVADTGDFLGLDNQVRGYCLFPQPDTSAAHLRLNALPEGLAIITAKVESDLAVVEVGPRDRGQAKPAIWGDVEGTAGKPEKPIAGTIGIVTDRPLVRVAAAHKPAPALQALGQDKAGRYRYELTGAFWGAVAFIWRAGVYAPFEATDDYLLPVTATPPAEPNEYFAVLQPFDQRWNADISGPKNPRPGTVYQATAPARTTDAQAGSLSLFLTNPSTKSTGLFIDTFQVKLEGAPQPVAFAGVRKPMMDAIPVRDLALRSFPIGGKTAQFTAAPSLRFIRPTLGISDATPIDLGPVGKGVTAVSPTRQVVNRQAATVTVAGKPFASLLYGAARITAPNEKRPDMQVNDYTGLVLVGKDAGRFALVGDHLSETGGLRLVGADGQPGLLGGAQPEQEAFAVKFLGAETPGAFTATVRLVTQAGNLGTLSTGKDGEPLAGLYYVDIPVTVQVGP